MGNLVKLHNKELDNLCKASSIVRTVKSRLWWAVHVAIMREIKNAYGIFVGKHLWNAHFEGQKEDGRIII
jgi:hypothetical protein